MANRTLASARNKKEDEFYTQLSDIEKEMCHYREYFKGKTILCNCDDPRISNFFRYFALNFKEFGLKRLVTTCYKNQDVDLFTQNDCEKAVWLDYYGNPNDPTNTDFSTVEIKELKGDGDFRSQECIELLKQADIVITNPPFSLFREYLKQLIDYQKSFIILGNQNALTYKEVFTWIKENKLWLGYKNGDMSFKVPPYYEPRATRYWEDETGQKWRSMGNICWFTNIDTLKRHQEIVCYKKYTPEEFPRYDNYDAINVDKVADIPIDYEGEMGVPITFMHSYNPEQFEIIDINPHFFSMVEKGLEKPKQLTLRNAGKKDPYARILIKRKK